MPAPRTAVLADQTGHPWDGWGAGALAVVVDGADAAAMREDVRDIVLAKSASAAHQAGGFEPTFSLLGRLYRSQALCVLTRPVHSAPTHSAPTHSAPVHSASVHSPSSDPDTVDPIPATVQQLHSRALVEWLVADGVELIATGTGGGLPGRDGSPDDDGASASVRWVSADFADEPLIGLLYPVRWAHQYDRDHPGQKFGLARRLGDRLRFLDVHGSGAGGSG